MKTQFTTLVTVAAVGLAVPSFAQDAAPKNQENAMRAEVKAAQSMRLGKLERASQVLSADIKGSEKQQLGKVKELAVDLESGRIVEVIVATGGFAGVNTKLVALPPGIFAMDAAEKELHLNLVQPQLKDDPEFDMAAWIRNFDTSSVVQVYQRYELTPYFTPYTDKTIAPRDLQMRVAAGYPPVERLGYVEKASKVLGMAAVNKQNENLGKVEELIVDVPSGRVVEVIISSGGFLGMSGELSPIPPAAFQYTPDYKMIQLDTTKEALSRAPHFKSKELPDHNRPEQIRDVYRSYNIQPYFDYDADNTARNIRDREGATVTPMDQGNSPQDLELTRQIRQQLMAHADLSANARNLKVVTVNGKVTLRGPVNNEAEKRIVMGIARTAAPTEGMVTDLIEVKNSPESTSPIK